VISTSPQQKEKSFRADINGLRAWAVISVVFYHFSLSGFGGGFVGVDVFFVISGFLMSGIIYNGLNKGEFSLVSFYLARARRIIPALGMLSLVLLIVGWFVLPPADYSKLGRHIASALGFFSNIQFWSEAGYFDTASHEKWLLHTWSLSVEWQFYMLLPLIMAGIWKVRPDKKLLVLILVALFAGSLYLSATLSVTDSSAAFYLLPMRAWEMLAGGLVFLVANKLNYPAGLRRIVEFIGFSLIVYLYFFLILRMFGLGIWR
jgi:Predicted acyltransferases